MKIATILLTLILIPIALLGQKRSLKLSVLEQYHNGIKVKVKVSHNIPENLKVGLVYSVAFVDTSVNYGEPQPRKFNQNISGDLKLATFIPFENYLTRKGAFIIRARVTLPNSKIILTSDPIRINI